MLLLVVFSRRWRCGVSGAADEDQDLSRDCFSFGLRRDSRGFLSAAEVQLPEGLPVLEPGLQVWGGDASFESLRTRIAEEEALNCELFWLPSRRLFGHDTPKTHTWMGPKMSLAEALRWRRGAAGELPRGPIFVEGPRRCTLATAARGPLEDLQSLVRDCPVVISGGRRVVGRAGWLKASGGMALGADEDPPLT